MKPSEKSREISAAVEAAARTLADSADQLRFGGRTAFVYNPLDYAWESHAAYIRRYGAGSKRVLFLGMNPGPWGMAQTGVPFGEVSLVRDWLQIEANITGPQVQHPKRRIHGFDCSRSEVSGRRLWGLMRERFGTPDRFFQDHYVANYCPLIFLEEGGKNLTPDKLPATERENLFRICDSHLQEMVRCFHPDYVIGIGKFAAARSETALRESTDRPVVGSILHPSPASPLANRGWAEQVYRKLGEMGIWKEK